MGLQDVVRWMLPKEDHFYGFLERQAEVAHEAALVLKEFSDGGGTLTAARERTEEIEHRGDVIVREVEDALARTFVTPIDREDIHKLSTELDDVLDLAHLAILSCELLGVQTFTPPMTKLIAILLSSTTLVKDGVPKLRKHRYVELVETSRSLRTLEKEGDAVFRKAMSDLFHDANIAAKDLLRDQEVLRHLENAIDRCEHVGATLGNLAVKHG